MKLGIYGDSYADYGNPIIPKDTPYAWFNILGKKLNCEVNVLGETGTSVFDAYKKFLESYKNFDCIIFVVTEPIRYTKSLRFEFDNFVGEHKVTSPFRIELLQKQFNCTPADKKILQDLEGYFIMDDIEFRFAMTNLMMFHMSHLHPRVIFYPGFPNLKIEGVSDNYCLFEIINKQRRYYDVDFSDYGETENVIAHMCEEYNNAFAEVMYTKIKNNTFDFSSFDMVNNLARPKEYYYRKHRK